MELRYKNRATASRTASVHRKQLSAEEPDGVIHCTDVEWKDRTMRIRNQFKICTTVQEIRRTP